MFRDSRVLSSKLGLRRARVALPGGCGELIQGTWEGVRCLVSCPVDIYSVAEVALASGKQGQLLTEDPKAQVALRSGLIYYGLPDDAASLCLTSALPRGRGYASSTADIGATLYALGAAVGRPFSAGEVSQLAVAIEPTDSTIFPGLALFDHRAGSFYKDLGPAPPFAVLIIDPGGGVDTLAFNLQDHEDLLRRLAPQHGEAFSLLFSGLRRRNWGDVGAAATISACVHQCILPNPWLELVLALSKEIGGLGICRAHSGTILGILLDLKHADLPAAVCHIARRLPKEVTVRATSLTDGGPRFLSPSTLLADAHKVEAGMQITGGNRCLEKY